MRDASLLGSSNRIVVLRALYLGDLLCSVPALRALRRTAPEAHVALIGLRWARAFVDRFSAYIDELIAFPGYPGMPEREFVATELPPFLLEMQRRKFDLAIQLQGNGFLSNGLIAQLGAARTAGFYLPGTWRPDETYIPYPASLPEPERHLALLRHLGAATDEDGLEFPITEADRAELATLTGRRWDHSYVVMHPGARDPRRRWPADRFAEVGDWLAREGLSVVLTGTEDEAILTAAVAHAMTAPAIDLAGRLSLGAMAALLDGAALAFTNDTGVSHLAAAVATPSVVVFSGSDPARWAPADPARHRILGGRAEEGPADHCCLGENCAFRVEAWQEVDTWDAIGASLDLLDRRLAHAG